MRKHTSWGNYPKVTKQEARLLYWRPEKLAPAPHGKKILPYGLGRSQGDSCLNDGGVLLDTSHLDRFISFNDSTGLLRVETGVTLAHILELFVPRGWMLPVIPGTKFVTVGGAIANDVHGKNHHRAGTFGEHVTQFELLRSDGVHICSPTTNELLFKATIGGLGLTGLITWAEIQLKRIQGPHLRTTNVPFSSLREALALIAEKAATHEFIIGQFDAVALKPGQLKGGLYVGNHTEEPTDIKKIKKHMVTVPLYAPPWVLNNLTMRAFNTLYRFKDVGRPKTRTVHYDPYFFPLDSIGYWNRMYGKRGFLQYQCVVPAANAEATYAQLLKYLRSSRERSYLASLKVFGNATSPGMLSFPQPGIVLALDFPYTGQPLLQLLEQFDAVVRAAGGAVYPAKDARMSPESFRAYYPRWQEFSQHIDPAFSSSFWRRVTG